MAARFSDRGELEDPGVWLRKPGPFYRFAEMTKAGPRWTGKVDLIPEKLDEPLRWRRPRKVFVNSMSDLFHEALPDKAIDQVFATMIKAQRHTFQVLTKRPERMLAWVKSRDFHPAQVRNIWLGVSVEDRQALTRADELRGTPASLRFISIEPLLEDIGVLDLRGIGWVIVGGESGPGARPFDVAWARSVVQQCRAAGVPVFVKQLGARPVASDPDDWTGHRLDIRETGNGLETKQHLRYANPKGGDPSEWPADLRVREFPPARP